MMERDEKTVRLLSRTLVSGAQVLTALRDSYAYRLLQDALEQCLRAAMRPDGSGASISDVCAELQRTLEEVGRMEEHDLRPFLIAERNVLHLLVHVRQRPVSGELGAAGQMPPAVSIEPASDGDTPVMGNGHLSDSAQQVFLGIQKKGPARAKDIIAHCSPMSERTIRRSLRELVRTGLVVKDVRHGGIRYRVAHE